MDPANLVDPTGNFAALINFGTSLARSAVAGARAAGGVIGRLFSSQGGSVIAQGLGKQYFKNLVKRCSKGATGERKGGRGPSFKRPWVV